MLLLQINKIEGQDLYETYSIVHLYEPGSVDLNNGANFEIEEVPRSYIDETNPNYSFYPIFNSKTKEFEYKRFKIELTEEQENRLLMEKVKLNLVSNREKLDNVNFETITLEEIKILKVESLKEECTSAIHDGFTSKTLGKSFGFNEHDQSNFTQQLLLVVASNGNYTQPIKWKALNGEVITMNATEFIQLVNEAEFHKRTNQNKYWTLEAEVKNAKTLEEVVDIVW